MNARKGRTRAKRSAAARRRERSDRIADYLRLRNAAPAPVEAFRWAAALRWAAFLAAAFLSVGACFGFARIAALAAKIVVAVAVLSLAVSGLIAVALVACIIYRAIRPRPEAAVPEPEKDVAPGWFAEVKAAQASPGILRSGSWTGAKERRKVEVRVKR